MKKLTILISTLLILQLSALAQPCLPEGITFNNQAQIDSFPINYSNCTVIEGNVTISGDGISNLNGLSVLTSLGGLRIEDNDWLTSLSGLENVSYIGWAGLRIIHNDNLNSLSGLDNVTSIGGILLIESNPNLTSLSPLENVTYIEGDLRIIQTTVLTSLTGLENLTSIGGDLEIRFAYALTDITALQNVTSLGGGLVISYVPELTSLSGLENLTSLGFLEIWSTHALTSLTALENVTSITGNVSISNTEALTNLTGLENVSSIGGDLRIGIKFNLISYPNTALTSLTGLEGLISIGGDLGICLNYNLSNLLSLGNLTTIGGDLSIKSNGNLTSLNGLDNINPNSINNLVIEWNYSLSNCEAQSICEYLTLPNGDVYINNNATGCETPEEVIDACESVAINEISLAEIFNITPNPIESTTVIVYTLHQYTHVIIKIFDLSGREVVTLIDELHQQGEQIVKFDSSQLKSGIYFCSLQTNNPAYAGQTIKIIKH